MNRADVRKSQDTVDEREREPKAGERPDVDVAAIALAEAVHRYEQALRHATPYAEWIQANAHRKECYLAYVRALESRL